MIGWFVCAGSLLYLAFFPPRFLLNYFSSDDVIFYHRTNQKKIYLTIDDAPSEGIGSVLNVLDQYKVKATFFCIGEYIERYPHIFKMITEGGHQVGNHDIGNRWTILRENISENLLLTHHCIQKWSPNQTVKFFRPGSGFYNQKIREICEGLGYRVVLGDVYAHDCLVTFPWFTIWHAKLRVRPGSIIILHVGTKERALRTAKVLEEIIPYFQQQGYTFELLE